MRKLALSGLVVILVLGVAGAVWWRSEAPMREVRERVLRSLRDPGSAEFSAVVHDASTGVGCGFVNARNSLGGMAGSVGFVAFPDGDVRFEPALTDPTRPGWSKMAMTYCERTDENAAVFGSELMRRMAAPIQ